VQNINLETKVLDKILYVILVHQTAVTKPYIQHIEHLLMGNSHFTLYDTASAVNINVGNAENITHSWFQFK
jgi:hypothetical protein